MSTEAIIGLTAELHVLRVALLASQRPNRASTLLGWRGWTQGRDFVFGAAAIEVKATLADVSRHAFSGVHQLEPQRLEDGGEESLHLMSFGIAEVEQGGQSLPELVDDLLSTLADGEERSLTQLQLLNMIARYGGAESPTYDHDTMRDWSVYQARYAITFGRLYSVADEAMRLLSRGMIEQTFAVPDSVTFELQLPPMVSAFNPATSWQAEIAGMVAG
jgi:hypothetical protein